LRLRISLRLRNKEKVENSGLRINKSTDKQLNKDSVEQLKCPKGVLTALMGINLSLDPGDGELV
jgi:hypothetical protein